MVSGDEASQWGLERELAGFCGAVGVTESREPGRGVGGPQAAVGRLQQLGLSWLLLHVVSALSPAV